MRFGTELKLKKDWEYNEFFTFEKGEILKVVFDTNKYGIKLHHPQIRDLLDFKFNYENRDSKIEEYFEVVESFDDRLAELEKVILDYYLAKGYQVGVGDWVFKVEINSRFRSKSLSILFCDEYGWSPVFTASAIKSKKMFDKAIEHFTIKNNKQYVIHQVDEFTPAQKIATFDTKNEAEKELDKIENESTKIDEFTCFYISEEKGKSHE